MVYKYGSDEHKAQKIQRKKDLKERMQEPTPRCICSWHSEDWPYCDGKCQNISDEGIWTNSDVQEFTLSHVNLSMDQAISFLGLSADRNLLSILTEENKVKSIKEAALKAAAATERSIASVAAREAAKLAPKPKLVKPNINEHFRKKQIRNKAYIEDYGDDDYYDDISDSDDSVPECYECGESSESDFEIGGLC